MPAQAGAARVFDDSLLAGSTARHWRVSRPTRLPGDES